MMPECNYTHCHKVAEKYFGRIDTGRKDGYGKDWPESVYLCKKHANKIAKKLGLRLEDTND